jgi:hypothetical protein
MLTEKIAEDGDQEQEKGDYGKHEKARDCASQNRPVVPVEINETF